MPLGLNIGKCTLLGNYRENNEDAIEVKQFPDMIIGIVADGMGGQAAGEVASKRAIEIVPRELKKYLSTAMGNASDQVKAEATATTDSYNDEGFAKAMEHLILGP